MTYVWGNPKTKKAVKDALARGEDLYAFEPGLGTLPKNGGRVFIEGPHFPEPHRWYGEAQIDPTGKIISVK
jgi:hypothetical protein